MNVLIRRIATLVALPILLAACGDGTTGPADDIDPALVGSWESVSEATDAGGQVICEFVDARLDFARSGVYRYRTWSPGIGRVPPCPGVVLWQNLSGRWSVETDGTVTFSPSLAGGDEPAMVDYEIRGNELVLFDLVVYRKVVP